MDIPGQDEGAVEARGKLSEALNQVDAELVRIEFMEAEVARDAIEASWTALNLAAGEAIDKRIMEEAEEAT